MRGRGAGGSPTRDVGVDSQETTSESDRDRQTRDGAEHSGARVRRRELLKRVHEGGAGGGETNKGGIVGGACIADDAEEVAVYEMSDLAGELLRREGLRIRVNDLCR